MQNYKRLWACAITNALVYVAEGEPFLLVILRSMVLLCRVQDGFVEGSLSTVPDYLISIGNEAAQMCVWGGLSAKEGKCLLANELLLNSGYGF